MPVRALLVDDSPHRAGLRPALDTAEDIVVVGEARTVEEAVRLAAELRPDVVLMDLLVPHRPGIDATRAITATADPPRVLVVSIAEDDDAPLATLRASGPGFADRAARREQVVRAVWKVAEGGAVFGPMVAGRFGVYFTAGPELPCPAPFPDLTTREREILELIACGHDNRQIARRLTVADKTVRNHVSNLFAKLGVSGRTQAAARARDAGFGR
ncbi:response regulator transcription factor [Streptomyces sp. SID3343]|uniref:LuxR C-terminal-related transcriptional regulator n=1 Tax=Streptomyces sp. SID3343 TaxID=2690260 RepID=UPI00136DC06F|nr:response regulator transcription factor [Streptomyces sp. SID3343]MYW02416.1 response regulator [Streptomyces sp. SID3343]